MSHIKSYHDWDPKENNGLTYMQVLFLDSCSGSFGSSKKWFINKDTGLIDVNGNFKCVKYNLQDFKGIRFGVINGYFDCSVNLLNSLDGGPKEVLKDFKCSSNNLNNLKGAPEKVLGDFNCGNNNLKSLEGSPEKINGHFFCKFNELKTLEGGPKEVLKDFDCQSNKLINIKGLPQKIGGNLICYKNNIVSLDETPSNLDIEDIEFSENPVSKETLELIFNKIQAGTTYEIALASLKNKIPKKDWDLLYKPEMDKDLIKGASTLDRFGII